MDCEFTSQNISQHGPAVDESVKWCDDTGIKDKKHMAHIVKMAGWLAPHRLH